MLDRENPIEFVPGCQGRGREEVDYCYLPEESFQEAITTDAESDEAQVNEGLQLKDYTRTCTEHSPCQLCEGDCDQDIDCDSNLVCFHRRFGDPLREVPGCPGRGVAGGDYCIEAK